MECIFLQLLRYSFVLNKKYEKSIHIVIRCFLLLPPCWTEFEAH